MSRPRAVLIGLTLAAVLSAVGCGGGSADPKANLDQQANARVEAMKQLADAVARNAPPGELNGIIESFISNTLDVKANPDAARQVVEIYNTRVKGKLKSDQAGQVKAVVDGIENDLKR
jgi:hypothetical protein